MPPRNYILKVCLLGDGAVGKTSLVHRFVYDVFDDKYIMSFGTKVSKKTVELADARVDLMIWDILGQKTHESLHSAYYRGAVGAFGRLRLHQEADPGFAVIVDLGLQGGRGRGPGTSSRQQERPPPVIRR